MIRKKSESEIAILREGGKRLARILGQVAGAVRPGVITLELDKLARDLVARNGDEPSFFNYQPAGAPAPYPAALCVSVNDEVVHGIPSGRVLQGGDIVTVDLGLKHGGLYTDMAITVPVGQVSPEALALIRTTEEALAAGIAAARPGARVGAIGAAVEAVAKRGKYGLVRDLAGHGVGYAVHEEPFVPNFGRADEGETLEAGMVLALEPMLTTGGWRVHFLPDGYTVKTADGSLAAHCELTIVINNTGAEVLTR